MLFELISAAGRQWTLNSMAMFRLNGLMVDHIARLTFLQMQASTAYLQLGTEHVGSLRQLDNPQALAGQVQRHHQALDDMSRRFTREATSLNANLQRQLGEELQTDARDNVICFATALQQRISKEPG